jgi:hypothetical protein
LRAWTWALAIGGATLLLAAVEASTAPGAGGLRTSRDAVRLLLAAPLVAGTLVSLRVGARSEAVGLAVAAACLLAAAGVDAVGTRWISAGADAAGRLRREAVVRVLSPLVALGVPALAGALALRIPAPDLWTGRRPVGRAIAAAAALGIAIFPLVAAANVYGNAAVRALMAAGAETGPRLWPDLAAAARREFFPTTQELRLAASAVRLGRRCPSSRSASTASSARRSRAGAPCRSSSGPPSSRRSSSWTRRWPSASSAARSSRASSPPAPAASSPASPSGSPCS